MPRTSRTVRRFCIIILVASGFSATTSGPKPPGKLVDLGGHRLQVNCTGKGSPTGQRVGIGGKATMRLGDGAKGLSIPPPHEDMKESDKPSAQLGTAPQVQSPLDPMYKVLPQAEQKWQLWAQSRPEIEDAEGSQREWSGEYFAKWLAAPQAGTLGSIPLIVLTREGGYKDGEADIPVAQLEKERKEGQAKLALLSTNSKQVMVPSGHNMELEAPGEVTKAIWEVVDAVRRHGKL